MFIDTPTQGTFHATLDGKPLVLVDNNRFTGMVTRSSVDPVTNQPAENVMSTFHCADKRDILLTIGYDGKTGEKKIANAMMNIPNKTYSSNGSFDRANLWFGVVRVRDDAGWGVRPRVRSGDHARLPVVPGGAGRRGKPKPADQPER